MAVVYASFDGQEWLDFILPADDGLLNRALGIPPAIGQSTRSLSKSLTSQRAKKRVNLLREELAALQHEKKVLEAQLALIRSKHKSKCRRLSFQEQKWQRIAQKQYELKLRAEREHDQLSATLAEQMAMKREMEAILFKKPRLMTKRFQDEPCHTFKLSADAGQRLLDIHAIADRQLDLIDSDMMSLGLVDSAETIETVRHDLHNKISEGVKCTRLKAASFSRIESAIWKTMLQMHTSNPGLRHLYRDPIDSNTSYVRVNFVIPNSKKKIESGLILKREQLGPRTVRMALRSIANDEAHPFEADSFVCNQYAWAHVEETDEGSFVYKSFVRTNSKIFQLEDIPNLVLMSKLVCADLPWKTQPPLDPMTISTSLFEATFRTFQDNLKDQFAEHDVLVCE
ncbi:hypothetical protein AeMF1_005551 [Aphanomyces euteiches]|nr:hypothetical protein AeMF1_005551 [Aphanomyces euteiches]